VAAILNNVFNSGSDGSVAASNESARFLDVEASMLKPFLDACSRKSENRSSGGAGCRLRRARAGNLSASVDATQTFARSMNSSTTLLASYN
jgi:hypothetical protein